MRNHEAPRSRPTRFQTLALAGLTFAVAFASRSTLAADVPAPGPDESVHEIVIPRISEHPDPTTNLAAPPWDRAARVTGFHELTGKGLARQATWVYLFYDADTLWLAFRCELRGRDKLVTQVAERDGTVWRDDSIEVFLDPGSTHSAYFQIISNSAGVVYDASHEGQRWNADLKMKTAADETGWTVVAGIPFAEVQATAPQAGQTWGMNLCSLSVLPEKSCWSPARGILRMPRYFGHVIFGGEDARGVRLEKVDPITIGVNVLKLDPMDGLRYEVVGSTGKNETAHTRSDHVTADGTICFTLADDRVRQVTLTISDADGKPLVKCRYPMASPEVSTQATALESRLAAVSKSLDNFTAEARPVAEAVVKEVRSRLGNIKDDIRSAGQRSGGDWLRLDEICTTLSLKLDGPECLLKTLAHFPDAPFALGLDSPMKKVMIQDFVFEGDFGAQYDLALARNEHEALQVVVIPFPRDLEQASVKASPLLGKDGKPMAGGKVEVSLVGHVDVADNARYDADYHGWWPDALLNFQTSCDATVGQHVAFWIDVATHKDTPAGDYQGTITVRADGCKPLNLRLNVKVWDFELIDGTHLRNAFTYKRSTVASFYGKAWTRELGRKYDNFLLDHRLNIDDLYRRDRPDIELLKYGAARGMNAFNVGASFRRISKTEQFPELQAYLDELKKEGLFEFAYVYGYDEAKDEKFPEMKEVFERIHELWPGLDTMTTAFEPTYGRKSSLREAIDIWVPLTDVYDVEEARALRAEGKKVWWYICIEPVHPYANWLIEYPAIEARLLPGAMSYRYEADGFLYYLINLWRSNRKPITAGPFVQWDTASFVEMKDPNDKKRVTAVGNGDGNLIYPGADGPLSTIRLENIRDGFEDYEYLYMLKEMADRVRAMPTSPDRKAYLEAIDKLLAVPDSVVKSTTAYTLDPKALASYRTELAEAIITGRELSKAE